MSRFWTEIRHQSILTLSEICNCQSTYYLNIAHWHLNKYLNMPLWGKRSQFFFISSSISCNIYYSRNWTHKHRRTPLNHTTMTSNITVIFRLYIIYCYYINRRSKTNVSVTVDVIYGNRTLILSGFDRIVFYFPNKTNYRL